MEARLTVHPSAETLKAFGLGALDEASAETVVSHLENCVECRSKVVAQSGNDFLDRLRRGRGLSNTPVPTKSLSGIGGGLQETLAAPATPPPIPDLPPELANSPQFEIIRELGRGGMGVVYLARNRLMARHEVLKVVNQQVLDRSGGQERFLREIQSAAMLSHPNVVTAYSVLPIGEVLVFAMEYIEGEDLAKLVKSRGPLPVPRACYYVQQAALGLQHAFEKKMVHRDIKPQNLILCRDRKKQVVKVLDFGLAKVLREEKQDRELTGTGQTLGTPDYMAPEQMLDAASADIRADIYSLGCTLYYMLTGEPPFKRKSVYEVLQAHQSMEAKPLNLMRSDVPEELAAVVRKMMAKEPAKRYLSPVEVVQALAPFVKAGDKGESARQTHSLSQGLETPQGKKARQTIPSQPITSPAVESRKQEKPKPLPPEESAPAATDTQTGTVTKSTPTRKSGVNRHVRALAVQLAQNRKWLIGVGIGPSILLTGLLVLWASGVFKPKTPTGTIIVENVPADADVHVEGTTITLSRKGEVVTVTEVPEGPHKLKVIKDGKQIWTSDVTVKVGGNPIRLRREPPPKPEPTELKVLLMRGEAHYVNNKLGEAIADYTEAILGNPKSAPAFAFRARAYQRIGENDLAIADSNRAIELDPKSHVAYYSRGLAYSHQRKFDKAIEDLTKAIQFDSKSGRSFYHRGSAHAEKGDYGLAIKDYTEAIRLEPSFVLAWKKRAAAYKKIGNDLLARRDLSEVQRREKQGK